jgi:hypothetical protein
MCPDENETFKRVFIQGLLCSGELAAPILQNFMEQLKPAPHKSPASSLAPHHLVFDSV